MFWASNVLPRWSWGTLPGVPGECVPRHLDFRTQIRLSLLKKQIHIVKANSNNVSYKVIDQFSFTLFYSSPKGTSLLWIH